MRKIKDLYAGVLAFCISNWKLILFLFVILILNAKINHLSKVIDNIDENAADAANYSRDAADYASDAADNARDASDYAAEASDNARDAADNAIIFGN